MSIIAQLYLNLQHLIFIIGLSMCFSLIVKEVNSHTRDYESGAAVRLSKNIGVHLSMISAKLEQIRDNRINDTPASLVAIGSVASYFNKSPGHNMSITNNTSNASPSGGHK